MVFASLNLYAVIAATLVSLALGIIWFAPFVFGRFIRDDAERVLEARLSVRPHAVDLLAGMLLHGALFLSIAYLLGVVQRGTSLFFVSCALSCVVVFMKVSSALWEHTRFSELLVRAGYVLLSVWSGIGIVVWWPW